MNKLKIFFLLLILLFPCCKKYYSPKPIGYLRIDFPEKKYLSYSSGCPFRFEYPVYGSIHPDKDSEKNPCWLNLRFHTFNGTLHLSYKKIDHNLNSYIEDSHTFVYKHTIKADAIEEKKISFPEKKVYGIYYLIEGNAASSTQFFLTDSNRHFLRGALYFNQRPNIDSLMPVIEFIREDIWHLITTTEWK